MRSTILSFAGCAEWAPLDLVGINYEPEILCLLADDQARELSGEVY